MSAAEYRAEVGMVIHAGRPIPYNATQVKDTDNDTWNRARRMTPEADSEWTMDGGDPGTSSTGQQLSDGLGPLTVTDLEPWCPECERRNPHDHVTRVVGPSVLPPISHAADPRLFTAGAAPRLDVAALLQLIGDYGSACTASARGGDPADETTVLERITAMLRPLAPRRWPALQIDPPPADLKAVRFTLADRGDFAPPTTAVARRNPDSDSWTVDHDEPITWHELRSFDLEEVFE